MMRLLLRINAKQRDDNAVGVLVDNVPHHVSQGGWVFWTGGGPRGFIKESKHKRAASGGLCCCAYTLPTTYWALLFVLSTRPSRSLLFALASTFSFFFG